MIDVKFNIISNISISLILSICILSCNLDKSEKVAESNSCFSKSSACLLFINSGQSNNKLHYPYLKKAFQTSLSSALPNSTNCHIVDIASGGSYISQHINGLSTPHRFINSRKSLFQFNIDSIQRGIQYLKGKNCENIYIMQSWFQGEADAKFHLADSIKSYEYYFTGLDSLLEQYSRELGQPKDKYKLLLHEVNSTIPPLFKNENAINKANMNFALENPNVDYLNIPISEINPITRQLEPVYDSILGFHLNHWYHKQILAPKHVEWVLSNACN